MLTPQQDAFGCLLRDALEGRSVTEIVERDDGFITAGTTYNTSTSLLGGYFASLGSWPPHQRRAMRFVRRRVIDVGCGAGRVTLHLQERGHEVVAIDVSPGAIDVCRARGVRDARVLALDNLEPNEVGVFDTVVMLGNNLGLLASVEHGRRTLKRLMRITRPGSRIVGDAMDPYTTEDPLHLSYHERNRQRGRMPGQVRIRVRHRNLKTPWFDYLLLSRDELRALARGRDWVADQPSSPRHRALRCGARTRLATRVLRVPIFWQSALFKSRR